MNNEISPKILTNLWFRFIIIHRCGECELFVDKHAKPCLGFKRLMSHIVVQTKSEFALNDGKKTVIV